MTPRCGRVMRRCEAVWGAQIDPPQCGRPAGHNGQCRSVEALRREHGKALKRRRSARLHARLGAVLVRFGASRAA